MTLEITLTTVFLEPLYDDFTEMSYIKKFTTIFSDDTFRNFFSPALLWEEITQTFNSRIFALNKDEPTYEARKKYYERQMEEELDRVDSYEKNKKVKKGNLKKQMKILMIVLTLEKQKWWLNLMIGNLPALNLSL